MNARNKFLLSSVTLAVWAMMEQASAQQTTPAAQTSTASSTVSGSPDSGAPIARIEVTGSAIKRVDAETALPVTIIKGADLEKMGYTSIADAMQALSMGATENALAAAGGTVINLRGLGLPRTLVLLDGQRLANEPTADTYANIEIIPLSAIDRIEILRDGASSLYGSDAMAGVVNFITKKSYEGGSLKVQGVSPDGGGGANEQRFSIIGGKGNIEADGWSLYGTIDAHKQSSLAYTSRPEAINNAELNVLGIGPGNKTAGSGGYAYPANIVSPSAAAGNPYGSTCLAPYSTPAAKNTCINNNTINYGTLFPSTQQITLFTNGELKLGDDNILSLQISYGDESRILAKGSPSTSVGFSSAPGGPAAQVMTITSSSPFYPGGSAGVPAVKGVTGQPLQLQWQDDPAGSAIYKDEQKNSRALLSDTGHFGAWDFKANLLAARDNRVDHTRSGYLNGPALDAGVLNGIVNPFGAQNAAGTAYLNSIAENGVVIRNTTSGFDSFDFSAGRDLMKLDGGALAVNSGVAFHHDTMEDISPQNNANLPYNGRAPYNVHASRNVSALFAEIDAPITKKLDIDFGVRADDYSDFGNTVNPKISLRYQPTDMLVLRASYNTGFRAPSLIDRYGYRLPQATTTTAAKWDDPLLCPGTIGVSGTGTITAAALAAGLTSATVCNAKQLVQTGSNPNVLPEHSRNFTAGFVLEPTKNLSLTVDYWRIALTDTLGSLSETAIFDNPTLYAANFVRNPNGSLAYVSEDTQNLGGTITSGEDVDLLYRTPQTQYGKFTFDLRGTYTNQYEQQALPGGAWTQNVGRFGGVTLGTYSNNPLLTFRWKHNLTVGWVDGPWSTVVAENFQTGYHDQNAVLSQYYRDIASYSVVNWTTTYSGIKNVTLSAGISNVFDRMPPYTNSQATGILLDYASAVGRAYILTATYKFF